MGVNQAVIGTDLKQENIQHIWCLKIVLHHHIPPVTKTHSLKSKPIKCYYTITMTGWSVSKSSWSNNTKANLYIFDSSSDEHVSCRQWRHIWSCYDCYEDFPCDPRTPSYPSSAKSNFTQLASISHQNSGPTPKFPAQPSTGNWQFDIFRGKLKNRNPIDELGNGLLTPPLPPPPSAPRDYGTCSCI